MENYQQPQPVNELDNIFNISIDEQARAHFKPMLLFAKIIAWCAFAGYGITIITLLLSRRGNMTEMEYGSAYSNAFLGGISSLSIIVAIALIAVGILLNYYLLRFTKEAETGLQAEDSHSLNKGLNSLRMFFKIYGILAIIVLTLIPIYFIIVIAFVMHR